MRLVKAGLVGLSAVMMPLAAMAQEAAGGAEGPGGGSLLMQQLIMFLPIILIFYFLLIRPQQKRAKQHREMIAALARGDTVITSGGLIGKVTRVADDEITVELGENVRVRVVRSMVVDVRGKGQPVAANDSKP